MTFLIELFIVNNQQKDSEKYFKRRDIVKEKEDKITSIRAQIKTVKAKLDEVSKVLFSNK